MLSYIYTSIHAVPELFRKSVYCCKTLYEIVKNEYSDVPFQFIKKVVHALNKLYGK